MRSTGTENCNLVSGDRLFLWHKRLVYNNIEDLLKLKDRAIGLRMSEQGRRELQNMSIEKVKEAFLPNNLGIRAKNASEKVHTVILGPINPKKIDGYLYAIGFVDSFIRYQKVYSLKTKGDAIEKVRQFFTDKGKTGTLVGDGAGKLNSNDIK